MTILNLSQNFSVIEAGPGQSCRLLGLPSAAEWLRLPRILALKATVSLTLVPLTLFSSPSEADVPPRQRLYYTKLRSSFFSGSLVHVRSLEYEKFVKIGTLPISTLVCT